MPDEQDTNGQPAQPADADTPAGAPAQGAGPDEADPAIALERARAEAAEQRDQVLRARAEAENVRRRAEAEVAAVRKYAIEGFAGEMLRVHDSLALARGADFDRDNPEAVGRMLEGLDLTLRQMEEALRRYHIEVIDPVPGDRFDPALHQAMGMQDSAEVPANHVLVVVQRGYRLHDRLLRPAMVIVARAGAQA